MFTAQNYWHVTVLMFSISPGTGNAHDDFLEPSCGSLLSSDGAESGSLAVSSNICIINEGSKTLSATMIICMNQRMQIHNIPSGYFLKPHIIILRHFTFKIVVIIFKPPHNNISSDISAKYSPNYSSQHQYKIRNCWAAKKQPCDGDTIISHANKPAFIMNWRLSTIQMAAPTQFQCHRNRLLEPLNLWSPDKTTEAKRVKLVWNDRWFRSTTCFMQGIKRNVWAH